MSPDFSKKTVDTIARRAAFKCSNPDCKVSTVGPNSDNDKTIVIGEAAHIFGARSNSKRYSSHMTYSSRAEITNAIWLCRNCHKLIDTDEKRYTTNLIFNWREKHEEYILAELGNASDKMIFDETSAKLQEFKAYPPIIKRIIIDEPPGWEWRLAAELLTYLNKPTFRKLENLKKGLYVKPLESIKSENIYEWINIRLEETMKLMQALESLLERLTISFGAVGEPGNLEDIHHICCLIKDLLEQAVYYEERIYFVYVPKEYERIVELLKDIIGSQVQKLSEIPDSINYAVSLIGSDEIKSLESPKVITKTITLELPENWAENLINELKLIQLNESG